jgi:hypothetical protein
MKRVQGEYSQIFRGLRDDSLFVAKERSNVKFSIFSDVSTAIEALQNILDDQRQQLMQLVGLARCDVQQLNHTVARLVYDCPQLYEVTRIIGGDTVKTSLTILETYSHVINDLYCHLQITNRGSLIDTAMGLRVGVARVLQSHPRLCQVLRVDNLDSEQLRDKAAEFVGENEPLHKRVTVLSRQHREFCQVLDIHATSEGFPVPSRTGVDLLTQGMTWLALLETL